MKKDSNVLLFWVVFGIVCLTALILMCADDAKGSGGWATRDGFEGFVPWATDVECDSAWSVFTFGGVAADTVHLYPIDDSTQLSGTGLSLDSLGYYKMCTRAWLQGTVNLIYDTTNWYHEGPGRITPASPSGSFVCRVYGYTSDLGSNYLSGALITAKLEKQVIYDTCAGMLVLDKEETARPTGTNGYWFVDLIQSRCIGGEKYVLTASKVGVGQVSRRLSVPDSATYYYKWGQ